jgi:CheY-like chemotaxis protein
MGTCWTSDSGFDSSFELRASPDLAVCDLSMPGIDGFTVCSTFERNKTTVTEWLAIGGKRAAEEDPER